MKGKLSILLICILLAVVGCNNNSTDSEGGTNQVAESNEPKFAKLMIEEVDESTFYVVATADGNDLNYAYYLYKDDELLDKGNYIKDAHFSYTVKEPGTYKVKVYIKDRDENIVSKYTEEVEMN